MENYEILKQALVFVLTVRDEQKENGTFGDEVYITMANGIIDRAKKTGLIKEMEGLEFVVS